MIPFVRIIQAMGFHWVAVELMLKQTVLDVATMVCISQLQCAGMKCEVKIHQLINQSINQSINQPMDYQLHASHIFLKLSLKLTNLVTKVMLHLFLRFGTTKSLKLTIHRPQKLKLRTKCLGDHYIENRWTKDSIRNI